MKRQVSAWMYCSYNVNRGVQKRPDGATGSYGVKADPEKGGLRGAGEPNYHMGHPFIDITLKTISIGGSLYMCLKV